eukprot:scaffold4487_cov273-Chaetoceros_neogracile.AAC.46
MPIQQQKHTSTVPHVVSSGSTTSLSNTRSHRSNSSSSRSNSSSITHMPPTFTPSESIFTSGFGSTQSFLSLSDPLDSLADIPVMESFQPNPVNVMSNNLYNQQQYQQQPQNPETSQPSQRSGQQSLDFHNMQMNFLTTPDVIASNISSQQHNTNMQIGSYHQSNILPVPVPAPISSPTQTSPISQHTISNEAVAQIVSNTSVPEFLYQLTKMLTDEHRDIIEWSNAKIEVHNPHRLEVEVLNKYFRHSKYASFQRQLNYFGFRKLAGKGKMAPCSYVNENATTDLRSLLRMKRKTSATTKESKDKHNESQKSKKTSFAALNRVQSGIKRDRPSNHDVVNTGPCAKIAVGKGVRHQLNNYHRDAPINSHTGGHNMAAPIPSSSAGNTVPSSIAPSALAKIAVGKGVAHHFSMPSSIGSSHCSSNSLSHNLDTSILQDPETGMGDNFTFLDPSDLGMGVENSLSALQANYQNSLNEVMPNGINPSGGVSRSVLNNARKSQLSRNSSLVALAMIPSLETIGGVSELEGEEIGLRCEDDDYKINATADIDGVDDKGEMSFIDFPGE